MRSPSWYGTRNTGYDDYKLPQLAHDYNGRPLIKLVYEDIPISVGIVNGAVGTNLTDEQGTLKGGVKTENETVHAWAVNLFETCCDKARPVGLDTITV